ncbi:MAG: hypothetical protein K9L30_11985 [Desulfobacterales bacterium]|nr:hypothetical protein [Desulfobacterales bacterium]
MTIRITDVPANLCGHVAVGIIDRGPAYIFDRADRPVQVKNGSTVKFKESMRIERCTLNNKLK